jgi:hypothetical protein
MAHIQPTIIFRNSAGRLRRKDKYLVHPWDCIAYKRRALSEYKMYMKINSTMTINLEVVLNDKYGIAYDNHIILDAPDIASLVDKLRSQNTYKVILLDLILEKSFDDLIWDQLIDLEASVDIARLCHYLRPRYPELGNLSFFLAKEYPPHYPFKKSDQKKLFGPVPLQEVKKMFDEWWFDQRPYKIIKISPILHEYDTFCVCFKRSENENASLMLLMGNPLNEMEIKCCDTYSVLNVAHDTPTMLINSLIDMGKLSTRWHRFSESFWLLEVQTTILDIKYESSFNMARLQGTCEYLRKYEDFLEQRFIHDPKGKFRDRHILKGFTRYELILDIAQGNVNSPLIAWIKNDRNNALAIHSHRMITMGHGNFVELPMDIIRLIKITFVLLLFI